MNKWKGLEKEQENAEEILRETGAILSRPFHNRVRELLVEISKLDGITLEYLIMGMGGWSFGRKSLMKFAKGDTREFDDYMEGGPFGAGRSNKPEWGTRWPKLPKLAKELEEILMFLTEEPYMELLTIDEKEMKKLHGKETDDLTTKLT